jgi:hypothetical protein
MANKSKQIGCSFETVLVNGTSDERLSPSLAGNQKGKEFNNSLSPEDVKKAKTLNVLIDLRAPKTIILDKLGKYVKGYQSIIASENGGPGIRKSNKEQYLGVYDWIEKEKKRGEITTSVWRRIAKQRYVNDYGQDVNYAVRKVKRDYDRGKKIVDGGFRGLDK